MPKFYKGVYKVKHPEKYIGTAKPICRSGWEFTFARFLDLNKNVIRWGSELPTTVIEYTMPDFSKHRYIPDYYVEMRTREGNVRKFLVEVKPSKQSPRHVPPPKEPKKKTSKSLAQYRAALKVYVTNALKWKAAEEWCKARGITFLVITEKEAGIGFIGKKYRK